MTLQLLNLPVNIPWCQIAVSESSMDMRVGAERFPAPWRSSVAISVHEPDPANLPEQYAGERITYVKATCSITGYQPSRSEAEAGLADLDDGSSDFRMIFEEYLGCYGVLLNISFLPFEPGPITSIPTPGTIGGRDLSRYPHIFGLEPRNRDLYQSASETGEVLTASNSSVKTDKTSVTTAMSETGIAPKVKTKDGTEYSGISHKWGQTDQDTQSLEVDNSRERRETEGTVTQISQMYNILSGYHQGTNRATFLMLPRPHILQPTDRRTFVQGLRAIEGIQEFFLVVARPRDVEGMCIESFLQTGHYSEDAAIEVPEPQYDTRVVQLPHGPIKARNKTAWGVPTGFKGTANLDRSFSLASHFDDGFAADPRGSAGPVDETKLSGDDADGDMRNYSYNVDGAALVVQGTLESGHVTDRTYNRRFDVHLRRALTGPGEAQTDVADLLVAQRALSVCFTSVESGCPKIHDIDRPSDEIDPPVIVARKQDLSEPLAGEARLRIKPILLHQGDDGRDAATKETLRALRRALLTVPTGMNYEDENVGFLHTNYLSRRIAARLPNKVLAQPLTDLSGIDVPNGLRKSSVADMLRGELTVIARRADMPLEKVANLRAEVLRRAVHADCEGDQPEATVD